MRLRLNYTNHETAKGYDAGELKFIVSGLGTAYRSGIKESADVAANKNGTTNAYMLDYVYDNLTDTYIFTNHSEISPEVRFSGSFEILYDFPSRYLENGFTSDITAIFSIQEKMVNTNTVHFEFYSEGDSYRLVNNPSLLEGKDGLGQDANDYYWVKYTLDVSRQLKARSTKNEYFLMDLPEGAVVRNVQYNKFEKKEGSENTYIISYMSPIYKQYVIVGFPKDTFSVSELVDNHVELRGFYLDSSEDVRLAEDDCAFRLSEFEFDYSGNLYGIKKSYISSTRGIQKSYLYKNQVVSFSLGGTVRNPFTMAHAIGSSRTKSRIPFDNSYVDGYLDTLPLDEIDFSEDSFTKLIRIAKEKRTVRHNRLRPPVASSSNAATSGLEIATYSNALLDISVSKTQDIYIGDDFFDITTKVENGYTTYRTLEDDEYEINSIYIPANTSFYNANGYSIEAGKYTANIIIGRDLDADPIESFKIGTTGKTIKLPSGVTAVWIHIPDVDESLYFSNIRVNVELHLNTENLILNEGYIRNFTGLMVKKDGILLNSVSRESYVGDDSDMVADRDYEIYSGLHIDADESLAVSNFPNDNIVIDSNHYIQRDYANVAYLQDSIYHAITVSSGKFDLEGDNYTSNISYTSRFQDGETVSSWSVYSLLPQGMDVDSDKLEAEFLAGLLVSLKCAEGKSITKDQIINALDLDVVYDYQNTGRNLVKVSFDLNSQNLNITDGYLTMKVPIVISKDA